MQNVERLTYNDIVNYLKFYFGNNATITNETTQKIEWETEKLIYRVKKQTGNVDYKHKNTEREWSIDPFSTREIRYMFFGFEL